MLREMKAALSPVCKTSLPALTGRTGPRRPLPRLFDVRVARHYSVDMNERHNQELDFGLGHRHVVIQRRYEALGAVNDLLIAIWFLIGSFFFLNQSLVESGTWLFIVGCTQLLIKPALKLSSLIHVKQVYRKRYKKNRQSQNTI